MLLGGAGTVIGHRPVRGAVSSLFGLVALAAAVTSGCADTCPTGRTRCGEACVDLLTDVDHCGRCDVTLRTNVPGAVAVCSGGAPALRCARDDQKLCGDRCVAKNDPAHCLGCDRACPTPRNATDVRCVADADELGTCAFTCLPGFEPVDGQCAPRDCAPGECLVEGVCTRPDDPRSLTTCAVLDGPAAGRCIDCSGGARPNARPTCTASGCDFECVAGFARVDDTCIDVRSDPRNCGRPGRVCGPSTGLGLAAPRCADGECVYACADPTRTPCPTARADASCVDLTSDARHCGACDTPARPATACDATQVAACRARVATCVDACRYDERRYDDGCAHAP